MRRKKPIIKPWRAGWKESPHKPLDRATREQRRQWLLAHSRYLSQLVFNEAER
jgi:hypothetical protein